MPSEALFGFDCNAIVSALLISTSVPRRAFDTACSCGTILLSSPVLNEIDDVLRRPKLGKYLPENDKMQFLVALVREASIVEISESITDCRDPKDNKYLELAVSGLATCIVSGDQDLLVLNPYRDIPILTPRQFLDSEFTL